MPLTLVSAPDVIGAGHTDVGHGAGSGNTNRRRSLEPETSAQKVIEVAQPSLSHLNRRVRRPVFPLDLSGVGHLRCELGGHTLSLGFGSGLFGHLGDVINLTVGKAGHLAELAGQADR